MDQQDTKTSIRRPVVTAQATGQMMLFGRAQPPSPRHSAPTPSAPLRFVDPDPESLAFGDSSLRSYLIQADLQSAFVMREFFDGLDFSAFEARYKAGGRPPYAPRRMAALIIYGISQGVSSLRALEQLARRDLVALWLTGGICPDHSKLGRFIHLHQEELCGAFFDAATRAVLQQLPEVSAEIAGDGTIIEAAASRYVELQKEALEAWAEQARQDRDDDPDDPHKRQQLARAQHCVEQFEQRAQARRDNRSGDPDAVRISPTDPEATMLKMKGRQGYRFAYAPSLMVNLQRIILAQIVHQSSENAVVEQLLDQVEDNLGAAPQRVSLDAGYFCYEIVGLAHARNLDLLCSETKAQAQGAKKKKKKKAKKFRKSDFAYDAATDSYQCPAGQTLRCTSASTAASKYYVTPHCNAGCALREACTTSDRGRRVKRQKEDALLDAMREVMRQPRAQQAYRRRQGSVEPVFGELRHIQGLQRFRRRGLAGVQVEFALHAIAHNLRRLQILAGERLQKALWALWSMAYALICALTSPQPLRRHVTMRRQAAMA